MPKARITHTSRDSAEVEAIVLRQNGRTRLVFKPKIVNNDHDRLRPVNGRLVWQKLGLFNGVSGWADETHSPLTGMVAGSGVQLAMSTAEIFLLTQTVRGLYGKFWQNDYKLPGDGEEFELDDYAKLAAEIDPGKNLAALLIAVGEEGFGDVVRLLIDAKSIGVAVEQLAKLKPEDLADLGAVAGLSAFREAMELWNANKENATEEFWQKALAERSFVLSQVFAAPVTLFGSKCYVGGKSLTNKGGKEVDFLLKSALTDHLLLVEIKTPCTTLLNPTAYRDGVYSPSHELGGAVTQIATQRDKLTKDFHALRVETEEKTGELVRLAEPRCLVIAGNTEQLNNAHKVSSFELFRSGLRHTEVITFDELFAKLQCLIDLLSAAPDGSPPEEGPEAP
jgi:hypothetical protein